MATDASVNVSIDAAELRGAVLQAIQEVETMKERNHLTQMEALAVAVLKGDMDAARALCDMIQEEEALGVRLPPVKKIGMDVDKIRVCVFFPAMIDGRGTEMDTESVMDRAVRKWINGDSQGLYLRGAERIEIYEMNGKTT